MHFLDEIAALKAVQSMLSSCDTATLVVAFWGAGAIDSLGLDKPWRSLRIVCNLDSGACNPNEIERLRDIKNAVVKSDWRLHGKVYLTADKLVMGSSNASSNGLVVEGKAASGWAEANIESADPGLNRQLAEWCDKRFHAAADISSEMLALARIAWNARQASAPINGGLSSNLLDLVKREPDHPAFKNIKVVQWSRTITDHAEEVHKIAVASDGSLDGTDIYEGWGNEIEIGDWLLDFDVGRKEPKFTGYWQVVHRDEANDIAFVRQRDCVLIPTLGMLSVAKADLAKLPLGSDEMITAISDLVRTIDAREVNAGSRAFNKAMFSIYDQAALLGYRPTEFRSMVEKLGGVTSAKQLINKPRVSEGFGRLWELGRLDLSVEALVLRPEWQALFEAEEKARARQRLTEANYIFQE